MRLAVFGNKGYLGSQLEFWFSGRNHAVAGFDLPECDVSDQAFWRSFRPSDYDAILFFSGLTGTEKSFDGAESFLSVNELGLLGLLRTLAPLGKSSPKVVFPSTRLVFKGSASPLREDDPKETKTPYAVNKLACEGYLSAFGNRYGIPYAVLRICVPFGSLVPGGSSYGTVGFFERAAAGGKPIPLYGGGSVRRTFTHVRDVCAAVETLAVSGSGAYNLGGEDLSLREAALRIAAKHGVGVVDVPWPAADAIVESGSTVFDGTKLAQLMEETHAAR